MKQEESRAYKFTLWFFSAIVWILLIVTIIVAILANLLFSKNNKNKFI